MGVIYTALDFIKYNTPASKGSRLENMCLETGHLYYIFLINNLKVVGHGTWMLLDGQGGQEGLLGASGPEESGRVPTGVAFYSFLS